MLSSIINYELTYYEEYETFCFQNCIRQILEYYGISNAEFCINACLSIVYQEYEDGTFKVHFDDVAYGVLPSLQSRVIREKDYRDNNVIKNDNLEYIKHGYPLILTVDSFYLSYLPFYQKSHGRHTVIFAGEMNGKAYIIDWQYPWFFKGLISYEELFEARNSINQHDGGVFCGKSINNNWAYIKREGWIVETPALVNEFFTETKAQFYKPTVNGHYYGIFAYEKIKERIQNILCFNVEQRKSELKKIYNSLYWPIKKRKFFQYYIGLIIKNNIESYDCTALYECIGRLNNEWDRLIIFILKSSITGKDNSITSIVDKMELLIAEERKMYEMIL